MGEEHPVCEFTPEGMRVARNYLNAIRMNGWMPLPSGLLDDHTYSLPIEPEVYVESRSFANRREAGQYLADRFGPLSGRSVADNAYLWSWLGVFYLEGIVQHKTNRLREYAEHAYLLDPNRQGQLNSRHRLKLAYEIWIHHGEAAWFMLNEPVSSLGHFTHRLASAIEIFRSEGIIELAHVLYADKSTGRLRNNILGTEKASIPPGSLPRFIDVLNQLSMTYDVYGMEAEQLLQLLPVEFDRFKSASPVT